MQTSMSAVNTHARPNQVRRILTMANDSIPHKTCSRCETPLPLTAEYFHRMTKSNDGFRPECKQCRKADSRQYYLDNTDKIAAYVADWRKRNPDKCNEYNEDWKRNRRPVYLAGRKRRYNEQAENRRAKVKDWRKNNPVKVRIQWKTRQARKRAAEGIHTPDDIRQILEAQHGLCAYCGVRIFLNIKHDAHVDHIIALTRGGSNWPDNLAVTCAECNLSKRNKSLSEWQAIRGW